MTNLIEALLTFAIGGTITSIYSYKYLAKIAQEQLVKR